MDEFDKIVAANPDVFQVENDDCPMGDDCPIHYRLQERYVDEENETGRFIDYVGNYAVVTDMAPMDIMEYLIARADIMAGTYTGPASNNYQTEVIFVGLDGTLFDTNELSDEEYDELVVYSVTFNGWDQFEMTHEQIVALVEANMLPEAE